MEGLMNDKIVTHEDLPMLRGVRNRLSTAPGSERDLLDRLIAAAEADEPPLPEGWVVLTTPSTGSKRILFHHPDGSLTAWDDHGSP